MNKKYVSYSLLIGFLTFNSLSFSMHNAPRFIYYGSKALASSALPLATMVILHKVAKDEEEKIADLPDVKSKSPIVQEWAESIIEKSGCSKDDFSLKYGESWASFSNANAKYIRIPMIESLLLESALQQKRNANRWQRMTIFEKFEESLFGSFDEPMVSMENYNQHIDESSMVLKHEIGHIVANDGENSRRMKLAIPIAIETVCFGTSFAFNKLCKISPPKTIMKSLMRSGLAFGGIIPKRLCFFPIYFTYSRYREAEADKFACENAETKKELEASYAYWRLSEEDFEKKCCSEQLASTDLTEIDLRSKYKAFDPGHPYPADRADMVQKYINEWDAKHSGDKH